MYIFHRIFGNIICIIHIEIYCCFTSYSNTGKFEKSFAMWEDCAVPYGLIGIESKQWILGFSDCTRDRFPNRAYHEPDEIWVYDMNKVCEEDYVQDRDDNDNNEDNEDENRVQNVQKPIPRWECLRDVLLPFKMVNFGYVTTFDEKYLILFGGVSTEEKEELWGMAGGTGGEVRKRFDGIYILDLDTMVFHGCEP